MTRVPAACRSGLFAVMFSITAVSGSLAASPCSSVFAYVSDAINRYEHRDDVYRLPESYTTLDSLAPPREFEPPVEHLALFGSQVPDNLRKYAFVPSGYSGDRWDLNVTAKQGSSHSFPDWDYEVQYEPTQQGSGWAGIHFLQPSNNWGRRPGGLALEGATRVACEAQAIGSPAMVMFSAGGLGSLPLRYASQAGMDKWVKLDSSWRRVEIPLHGEDLSRVVQGFVMTFSESRAPRGCRIAIRDMVVEGPISQLSTNATLPDFYLDGAAHVYDTALLIILLVALEWNRDKVPCDQTDSSQWMRKARLLGESLLYCMDHDPEFKGSKSSILRNVYDAKQLVDQRTGRARVFADSYGAQVHTGNLAWGMLAMMALYRATHERHFLEGAKRIAEFIDENLRVSGDYGGYSGGFEDIVPSAHWDKYKIRWVSTEHCLDLSVSFRQLEILTGEDHWGRCADHARAFVDSMWLGDGRHGRGVPRYATGLLPNGSVSFSRAPLDVNAWAILADSRTARRECLSWCEDSCGTWLSDQQKLWGYKFASGHDGTWFEGTAHMACAYQAVGDLARADILLRSLEFAQQHAANADAHGVVATWEDEIDTGFGYSYYSRLHLGATAWFAFAEIGVNPFWLLSLDTADPEQEFRRQWELGVEGSRLKSDGDFHPPAGSGILPRSAELTLRSGLGYAENTFYISDFTSYYQADVGAELRLPFPRADAGGLALDLVGIANWRQDLGSRKWNDVDWNNHLVLGGGVDLTWRPGNSGWRQRSPWIRDILIRGSARAVRLLFPKDVLTPTTVRPDYDVTLGVSMELHARGNEPALDGSLGRWLTGSWELDGGIGVRYSRTNLYLAEARDFYLVEGQLSLIKDLVWPEDAALTFGPTIWGLFVHDLGQRYWNRVDYTNHGDVGIGLHFSSEFVSPVTSGTHWLEMFRIKAMGGYSRRWYAQSVEYVPAFRPSDDLSIRIWSEFGLRAGS